MPSPWRANPDPKEKPNQTYLKFSVEFWITESRKLGLSQRRKGRQVEKYHHEEHEGHKVRRRGEDWMKDDSPCGIALRANNSILVEEIFHGAKVAK